MTYKLTNEELEQAIDEEYLVLDGEELKFIEDDSVTFIFKRESDGRYFAVDDWNEYVCRPEAYEVEKKQRTIEEWIAIK